MQPQRQQPTRLPCPWDSPGKNTGVGCHFLLQCMKVKSESEVAQSCPTLHDPMDCSLPGSSIHGIFQARVLEWGAIAFSFLLFAAAKSLQSCPTLHNPIDGSPPGSSMHGILQARVLEWGAIAFSTERLTVGENGSCSDGWGHAQFSSLAQSCPTLCDPMNCSTPGLPVHHQLLEFTQTHVHRVGDAIQPSHPLSSSSPPAPNLSEHQSFFQ